MSATELWPIKRIDYVDISWRSAARWRETREGGENKLFSS